MLPRCQLRLLPAGRRWTERAARNAATYCRARLSASANRAEGLMPNELKKIKLLRREIFQAREAKEAEPKKRLHSLLAAL